MERKGRLPAGALRVNPDSALFGDQKRVRPRAADHDDKEQKPKGPLVKGTVARGHSVEVPEGPRFVRGSDGGVPVYARRCKRLGPGSVIELPEDEINRLKELGFLENPYRRLDVPRAPQ
jgi:hypothetical protein